MSSMAIMVTSIVACCIFAVLAFVFLIIWVLSFLRGGLQKRCPTCGAMMPTSAMYCNHCGAALPVQNAPRGGKKPFLAAFLACLLCVGLSVGGIVYGAVHTGIGVSQWVTMAYNLEQYDTNHDWNISFESVRSGWTQKNIIIKNGKPQTLHVQSHLASGSIKLEMTQNGVTETIDLSSSNVSSVPISKYRDGKLQVKVLFDKAKNGGVNLWWE